MFFRMATAASLLLATAACALDGRDNNATAPYSDETPLETLAADPAAAAILNKDLPGLLGDARYPMFKGMNLKSLQAVSGGDLSKTDVNKTVADLQALPER